MRSPRGAVLIIVTILLGTTIVAAIAILTASHAFMRTVDVGRAEMTARFLADSGIARAAACLNETNQSLCSGRAGPTYTGESNLPIGAGTVTITVTPLSDTRKRIEAIGAVPNQNAARASIHLAQDISIAASTIGFRYATQVGSRKFTLGNNARVEGSAYSNSSIIGGNGSRFTGDAFVTAGVDNRIENVLIDRNARAPLIRKTQIGGSAWSQQINETSIGGLAYASTMDRATVGGNATVERITNSTIGGNVWCESISGSIVGGRRYCPVEVTPPPDLAPIPLPVTPELINQWKTDAAKGGTIETVSPDAYATLSIGPVKINGNLILDNNQTLTISGTIHVTGTITLGNNARLVLDQRYGAYSGIIIADGPILIRNNGTVAGSGQSGSYVMLITTASGSAEQYAVDIRNNVNGAIIIAPNGIVAIKNTVTITQVTAAGFIMDNSTVLRYDIGFLDTRLSAGPTAAWKMVSNAWRSLP
ncbi:MAG: hypothetical protein V1723_03555 [Candidatus Uhrbacteria bacterium]